MHVIIFNRHVEMQEARWAKLESMMEREALASERTATAIEQIQKNTSGVIELYESWQGAARVGNWVGRLILWAAGIGTGLVALAHFFGKLGE